MTNAKDAKRKAREAAEAAQCANHREDIAALCDLILNQAKECTCSVTLADRRRILIELAARPMFTPGCSEAVVYEAIEDNLEMLREAEACRQQELQAARRAEYKRSQQ